MVEHIVGQHRVSVGSLFCELHAVKARVRAGWNVVHEIDGKKYSRECVNPESVSDHIFGCILIAEVFLPESDLVHNEYSKNEVIRMLTIHDLSETYTGDVPFFRKTADDELKEKQLMRRTISLGTVPGFRGILGWKSVWERWSRKETLNAQIAHDIDRIENYVQLMQYLRRSEPRCIIEDAKQWAAGIDLRLETDLGKEIFASLRHRGTELLKWFKDEQLP
jgi:5'-deoxynucleotidase YfbR-like HD superfamily hydrolase